jgi:hypothetical protein
MSLEAPPLSAINHNGVADSLVDTSHADGHHNGVVTLTTRIDAEFVKMMRFLP